MRVLEQTDINKSQGYDWILVEDLREILQDLICSKLKHHQFYSISVDELKERFALLFKDEVQR